MILTLNHREPPKAQSPEIAQVSRTTQTVKIWREAAEIIRLTEGATGFNFESRKLSGK